MKIVIASHFVKSWDNIYSPLVDNLEIIFKERKQDYLVIKHTLNNDFKSKYFLSKDERTHKMTWIIYKIWPLRYLTEIYSTIKLLLILWYKKEKIIFIWIDPLNAMAGYFFRFLNKKTNLIYYIPDYSPKRFKNTLLNWVYHLVEWLVSKKSDSLLCASSEIYKLKNKRKEVYEFKNYPPKEIISKIKFDKKNKNDLFVIWLLEDYYLMDEIFKAIQVILKDDDSVKLHIIWWWTKLENYKKLTQENKISKNVIFTWYLKKMDALNYISWLGISLWIYSNNQEYNRYRDSVKVRDSIACSIPIITTDNHSTKDDVINNKLWIVIDSKSKDLYKKIVDSYFQIQKDYDNYAHNCKNFYNKDYKNEIILDNIIKNA